MYVWVDVWVCGCEGDIGLTHGILLYLKCTFHYISPRLAPFSGLHQDFISKSEWGPGTRFTSYTLAIKIRRLSLKQIDPVCMNTTCT